MSRVGRVSRKARRIERGLAIDIEEKNESEFGSEGELKGGN